jgi:hypothetical protein
MYNKACYLRYKKKEATRPDQVWEEEIRFNGNIIIESNIKLF